MPTSLPPRGRRRAPRLSPLGLALVALLAASPFLGCASGKDLIAEDQARVAEVERVRAAERAAAEAASPTTRPAEMAKAPVLTFDVTGEVVVPAELDLREGLYTFRVMNNDPLPRYFWLRKNAGGGNGETVVLLQLPDAESLDHPVQLTPGEYLFSSPMPPEAKSYKMTVK